jgi:hypothetical protein
LAFCDSSAGDVVTAVNVSLQDKHMGKSPTTERQRQAHKLHQWMMVYGKQERFTDQHKYLVSKHCTVAVPA